MKTCFKCGEIKPLDEFYRHPETTDGRLGKCKQCTRSDVTANRRQSDRARRYDRERAKTPERIQHATETTRRWRREHPDRAKAHVIVAEAIRSGALTKKPCRVCGDSNVHAHHEDYAKPLEVDWLCPLHHAHETHGVS